jgi:DNA-binding protein H-NS
VQAQANNVTQLSPPQSPTHFSLSAHLQQLTLPELLKVKQEVDQLIPIKAQEARDTLDREMEERAKELGLEAIPTRKAKALYKGPNGEIYRGKGPLPGWLKEQMAQGRTKEEFLVE